MLVSGALVLAAQQAPPSTQKPQTIFRSGVDRVAVDVIVVDKDGRPVADLTPADFSLEVDGRRRQIASAEFISLSRLVDPGPPPVHYATNNRGASGRLIMLVIDQNNIKAGTGRLVFEAASKFIQSLNSSDRVGLHLIPGPGPLVDFTANHALVSQMIRQAVGRATTSNLMMKVGLSEAKAIVRNDRSALNEVLERECAGNMDASERVQCERVVINEARLVAGEGRGRTAESLVSLRDVMRRMNSGRGRKTMVLMSEGLVLDQGMQDLGWVAPLAAQAQVTLFVLQMESSSFGAGSPHVSPSLAADRALERDGLSLLAGLAGGSVVPLSPSNPWLGFSRVSTEVSGYYLLSFEPDPAERDGKTHGIRIETGRKGLTVRARKQFAMHHAPDAEALGSRISEVLISPLDATDVGLKAAPYVLRDASGKLKVLITAEVDRSAHAGNDAALGYTLVDQQGRLAGSHLEPSLGPHDGSLQHFTSAQVIDPGIYSLRLGVVDSSGREGSVGHTFEAKLHAAGQLHWSDLVLSEQNPVTQRIELLTDGPQGTALQTYLELYSEVQSMLDRTAVTIEISRREDGLTVASEQLKFSAAQVPGRRTGETAINVGLLGEGEFIARAIIRVDGKEFGRTLRPFLIKKRQP